MLGALARAGVDRWLPLSGPHWPWATLLVNVTGCVVLGWAVVRFAARAVPRRFVVTGLCGGLTTFSTLQLELFRLLDAGRLGLGALYVIASIAAGLAGIALGRRVRV
jgi:CrcB protein